MSDWYREADRYYCKGVRIYAVVWQDADLWRNSVFVKGDGEVDRGEWLDRESAIRNANSAMARLCWNRRFDSDCPVVPGSGGFFDDEDDDE